MPNSKPRSGATTTEADRSQSNIPTAPSRSRFLSLTRLPQVKARTGLSRAGIYQQMKLRKFPAQISLGGRAVGWIDAEIDQWIRERIAASREALGPTDAGPARRAARTEAA